MNIKDQIRIARKIAEEAHVNQYRRSGAPYIQHVEAVATAVSEKAQPAAWIHDVMEDHPERFTPDTLRSRGLSKESIVAVLLLDKNRAPEKDYSAYIRRIRNNPIAREVKIADINHNLSDNPTSRQERKYKNALRILRRQS